MAKGKRVRKPFNAGKVDQALPVDNSKLSNVDRGKDSHSREDLETYRPNYIKPHR